MLNINGWPYLFSAVFVTGLSCQKEIDPCVEKWRVVRYDLTSTAKIEEGELAIEAVNFQSTVAISVVSLSKLDNDTFTINFRDFYATQPMGRAGIIISDGLSRDVVGCAIRPGLISAFSKSLPVDQIDFRSSNSNVGQITVSTRTDSVKIQLAQGEVVCTAKGKFTPPFNLRLFVGAEQAPYSGKVGIRFSHATATSDWGDAFECNSIQ